MKNSFNLQKSTLSRWCKILFFVGMTVFFQSCSYTVIVKNINGDAEPDPNNHEIGFYNLKKVTKIDTVAKLSLINNDVMYIEPVCDCLYSFEYKVTFGDMLRNTFSKRKAIRVKYVRTLN
jgi:hypothetical protein